MRSLYFFSVILLVTFTLFFDMTIASPYWVCKPCRPDECEADPDDTCMWGETRDACNRRVCAKGPGERCASKGGLNVLGQCGEGMMCKKDYRCHGCSIQTMVCYP